MTDTEFNEIDTKAYKLAHTKDKSSEQWDEYKKLLSQIVAEKERKAKEEKND
jgi:hypothetical protein